MEQPKEKGKKKFLWVHKDEASLSLSKSDPLESKRIFQFVQHQRPDISSKAKDGQAGCHNLPPRLPHRASARSMQGRLRLPKLLSKR